MRPQNAVASPAVQAAFLAPDVEDYHLTESFEQGGVALNDGTQGRQVQNWRAWIDGSQIKVAPDYDGAPETLLVTATGVLTTVSLAFDSNMQPTICYTEDGLLKLRWFNVIGAAFQTDTFPGATSGKVSTDDKRSSQVAISDVLFAYTLGGVLLERIQRERYLTAHTIGPAGPRGDLILYRMGMNAANRMQYQMREPS